jgi:hypothetical protein
VTPKFFAIGTALAASLTSTSALACSSCGCTLTSDALSQGLGSQPGTTIDLRYDFVPQTRLRSGTDPVERSKIALPVDHEIERYTDNHYVTLTVDHQFQNDFGVTVQLPFIARPHATVGEGDDATSFSRTNGVGDIKITGRWQGFKGAGVTGVQLGFKLPTGGFHQTFRSGPQAGQPVDRDLQPGSGTTDLMIGAYHFGKLTKEFDFVLQAQGQIPLNSRDQFRPGASATFAAALNFTRWRSITPQLQLNFRVAEQDHGANSDRDNSGGEQLYISPGIVAKVTPRVSAFAAVQIPIYQRVTGYQLTPNYTLSIGIRFRL